MTRFLLLHLMAVCLSGVWPMGLIAGLACLCVAAFGAESPVRIVSVEPDSPYINPNGRLLQRLHPARFRVRLENTTDAPQRGVLAAEVIGNLGTVYGLAPETVLLSPRETRLAWALWSYPGDVTYTSLPNSPVKVMGAHWGHELRVAWKDSAGHILDRGQTVFAIEQDGSQEGAPQPKKTEPVTPRQAFDIRYSGYLHNPAFTPAGDAAEVTLELDGKPVANLLQGVAPSGNTCALAKLPSLPRAARAAVTCAVNGRRLQEAWLLDPDNPAGPRARRLYHRVEGKTFLFDVPAVGANAILAMETAPTHTYIAPVPLSEMAALGAQQYGPFRSFLQDSNNKPLTTPAQWAQKRNALRETIWKALSVRPEPKTTPLDPLLLSEECVPPQGWMNGVSRAYTRRKVSLQSRPGERMNVYLLIPQGIGPFPAIVALHQTVYEGKEEPIGLGGHYHVLNFGPFLASRGFVVVAPDSPTAGERYDPDKQGPYVTSEQTAKDPAWSLMGQRLHDHIRVLDYLETLPFVDSKRIGAIGHSLGGESTMMLTAMEDRVAAAVVSCGFTLLRGFDDAADTYAPPDSAILSANFRRLLQVPVKERKLPFDFDDCMALWAPRPVFLHDVRTELWPNAAQVAQAAVELQKLYRFLGAADRFYPLYSNQTHSFPSWVQPDTFDWLDYWLHHEP